MSDLRGVDPDLLRGSFPGGVVPAPVVATQAPDTTSAPQPEPTRVPSALPVPSDVSSATQDILAARSADTDQTPTPAPSQAIGAPEAAPLPGKIPEAPMPGETGREPTDTVGPPAPFSFKGAAGSGPAIGQMEFPDHQPREKVPVDRYKELEKQNPSLYRQINTVADQVGIPKTDLAAIVYAASDNNPGARNGSGMGYTGVTSDDAKLLDPTGAMKPDDEIHNLYLGALKYKEMAARYGMGTVNSFAAYHAGPNAVDGLLRRSPEEQRMGAPEGTFEFVNRVLGRQLPGTEEPPAVEDAARSAGTTLPPAAVSMGAPVQGPPASATPGYGQPHMYVGPYTQGEQARPPTEQVDMARAATDPAYRASIIPPVTLPGAAGPAPAPAVAGTLTQPPPPGYVSPAAAIGAAAGRAVAGSPQEEAVARNVPLAQVVAERNQRAAAGVTEDPSRTTPTVVPPVGPVQGPPMPNPPSSFERGTREAPAVPVQAPVAPGAAPVPATALAQGGALPAPVQGPPIPPGFVPPAPPSTAGAAPAPGTAQPPGAAPTTPPGGAAPPGTTTGAGTTVPPGEAPPTGAGTDRGVYTPPPLPPHIVPGTITQPMAGPTTGSGLPAPITPGNAPVTHLTGTSGTATVPGLIRAFDRGGPNGVMTWMSHALPQGMSAGEGWDNLYAASARQFMYRNDPVGGMHAREYIFQIQHQGATQNLMDAARQFAMGDLTGAAHSLAVSHSFANDGTVMAFQVNANGLFAQRYDEQTHDPMGPAMQITADGLRQMAMVTNDPKTFHDMMNQERQTTETIRAHLATEGLTESEQLVQQRATDIQAETSRTEVAARIREAAVQHEQQAQATAALREQTAQQHAATQAYQQAELKRQEAADAERKRANQAVEAETQRKNAENEAIRRDAQMKENVQRSKEIDAEVTTNYLSPLANPVDINGQPLKPDPSSGTQPTAQQNANVARHSGWYSALRTGDISPGAPARMDPAQATEVAKNLVAGTYQARPHKNGNTYIYDQQGVPIYYIPTRNARSQYNFPNQQKQPAQ